LRGQHIVLWGPRGSGKTTVWSRPTWLGLGVYRFSTDPSPDNANTLINCDFSFYPRIIPKTAGRILRVIVGAEVGSSSETSELVQGRQRVGRFSVGIVVNVPVDLVVLPIASELANPLAVDIITIP